jgi:hypothetical protein
MRTPSPANTGDDALVVRVPAHTRLLGRLASMADGGSHGSATVPAFDPSSTVRVMNAESIDRGHAGSVAAELSAVARDRAAARWILATTMPENPHESTLSHRHLLKA